MPEAQPHSVTFERVTKSFGTVSVLRDFDLEVQPGEFLVLLGESGSGKSTALRILAGLESATSGKLRIGDRDVTEVLPKNRDVAMVFQSYALYPHKTVAENVAYPLDVRGVPLGQQREQVMRVAKQVQLDALLDRYPRQLSGGQRQRVALARAMVRRPAVFLMDEPLSNLDAKLRGHMRAELAVLHERLGKTTVYVTHDQIEAMTLASRIVVFDKGRIQQVGTPAEVFNRPATLFVAGFIGTPTMNFLDARMAMQDGRTVLRGEGFVFPAPASLLSDAAGVTLGVRPQAWRLADGSGQVQLQVNVAEYLGTETVLVGHVAGQPETRLTAVFPGHRHDLVHQCVALEADVSALHIFSKSSGQRLAL